MQKLLLVFGTRPEAIKMAPLLMELKKYPKQFNVIVCVTAQHREMLDQVLDFFDIKPDLDLDIMVRKQSLSDLTANVLLSVTKVLKEHKPDYIIVHGDTTTTFSASLAAFYQGISVCHIEAGLRTFNMLAPFPEEFNRRIVSNIAKWHFTPTEQSKNNLLDEKISHENIWVTGNTVIDSLEYITKKFKTDGNYSRNIYQKFIKFLNFDIKANKYILVTGHRRENFGKGFEGICNSLKLLSLKHPFVNFVYPVHLNPIVLEPVQSILGNLKNVKILKPLVYEEFIFLLQHSFCVLTDSGGLQEEASSLGIPVLVMRDFTERPEAVNSGILKIVGTNQNSIINNISELLENNHLYEKIAIPNEIYGDGFAAKRIVKTLRTFK
jgi:UDP-N-acetylglucosamine 2-epimerase (non-hydrolysing)